MKEDYECFNVEGKNSVKNSIYRRWLRSSYRFVLNDLQNRHVELGHRLWKKEDKRDNWHVI